MPKKENTCLEDLPYVHFSDAMAKTVLNSLSAHIAILDKNGKIIDTNRAWREFAVNNGMPLEYNAIGKNYIQICKESDENEEAVEIARGIQNVIDKKIDEFVFAYLCDYPEGPSWYYMRAIRMTGQKPVQIVVSHEDITALKLTEKALIKSRKELEEQTQSLKEANIALKVLLKQREADKAELEKKVLENIKFLIFPYIKKLKDSSLKLREKTLVNIVDTHLKDIISPFLNRFSNANIILTPQETHVAVLVKDGKTSKEIADILNISENTVHFHRRNLRKKFGLSNRQKNLRTYLMSIS